MGLKTLFIGLIVVFSFFWSSPSFEETVKIPVSNSIEKSNILSVSEKPTSTKQLTINSVPTKPTWNAETFNCNSIPPPAGVANPEDMVLLSCPRGVRGGDSALREVRDALCVAGDLAFKEGYELLVTSAFRSYESQVGLWCGTEGTCFSKYPNVAERRGYCAVPGFSSHGLGLAIDTMLMKDGVRLFTADTQKQCEVDPKIIEKLAGFMYSAGFVRYEAEIWHFELGTNSPARGEYFGIPAKCNKS